MQFQPPVNGNLADPNRPFVNADPANGIEGSIPSAEAIEHPQREILSVITGAGLEPSGENLAQMFGAIQAMIAAAIGALPDGDTLPVGSILPCPSTTPWPGFYLADGSILTRADDADLWAYANASGNIIDEASWTLATSGSFSRGDGASTFRLPDYRGVGLRGFDGGRGLDTGRVFGTYQADQLKSHAHELNEIIVQSGVDSIVSNNVGSGTGRFTGSFGGAETRMKNTAVNFCIKY